MFGSKAQPVAAAPAVPVGRPVAYQTTTPYVAVGPDASTTGQFSDVSASLLPSALRTTLALAGPRACLNDCPRSRSQGLCACLNDCKLCLVSLCFPGVLVGQLYERVKSPGTFAFIAGVSLGASFLMLVLKSLYPDEVHCDRAGVCHSHANPAMGGVAHGVEAVAGLVSLVVAILFMIVRSAVRRAYGIPASCCGGCDDCCCALCCLPCASSQVMRHLNTHDATQYALCSTVGAQRSPTPYANADLDV